MASSFLRMRPVGLLFVIELRVRIFREGTKSDGDAKRQEMKVGKKKPTDLRSGGQSVWEG